MLCSMRPDISCRFCGAGLEEPFLDLGMSPLSNSFLDARDLLEMERFYPLQVCWCRQCGLVQLPEFESPEEIFEEYAYFSSYSVSWVEHARVYVHEMQRRLELSSAHRVIEIGSNDGYLLRHFNELGIETLGIEPARNVAAAAEQEGVQTMVRFFGKEVAGELQAAGTTADLLVANNVLAQVPHLNDFVAAIKLVLRAGGVITVEVPHLMRLLAENQFDTIYHEHFSYFSLRTVRDLFTSHDLKVFDVDELPTHGGSVRVYACHQDDGRQVSPAVESLLGIERQAGLESGEAYPAFSGRVWETKRALLSFLIDAGRQNKRVAAYGAPAKGNTLLNFCGIRTDLVAYTVDRNPYKQGKYLPGTHIPIHAPERLQDSQPEFVLVLPWNLREEIVAQLAFIRDWGGQFVFPIPTLEVVP